MPLLLVVLFIVVPIAELAVLIQVGQAIGVWWTIALLVADAVLGSLLARSQGRATWRRFNEALQRGPPAGARGDRRRARAVRRRAAADARASSRTSSASCCCCRRRGRSCAPCSCGASPARMVASMTAPRAGARPRPRPRQAYDVEGTAVDAEPDGLRPPPGRRPRRDRRRARAGRGRRPGPAFADAVTFAFGDADAQLYGLARLGLSPGEDGEGPRGSALAVLFAGREPVAAIARGGLEVADGRRLGRRSRSAGCAMTVDEPLRALDGRDGRRARTASTCASRRSPRRRRSPATTRSRAAGGMAGYEQLCGVTGTVRAGGRAREIRCLGQRGHGWGEPDWEPASRPRARSPPGPTPAPGVALTSVRPQGAPHADEPVWAALLDEEGTLPRRRPAALDDLRRRRPPAPRRARAVDADDDELPAARLGRGALRLDARPRRAAARLRVLPLADRGRDGVGRYDVLRRADAPARAASSRSRAGPSSRARGTRPRAPRSAPRTATAGRTRAPAPRRRRR